MDAMTSSMVRVNGVEVTPDASRPMVINININQPSALSCLLDSAKTAWKKLPCMVDGGKSMVSGESPSVVGGKSPSTVGGEQKVLGTVQIMIGLLCVSFAVILCFVGDGFMFWTGSGFWTGVPFIVTGAVAILSERRASCCWRCAAFLLHLVSLGVAIGAIVVMADEVSPYSWSYLWDPDWLCKPESYDNYFGDYYGGYPRTTTPPPFDQRVEECVGVFYRLKAVHNGMNIVILVSTCLALCVSLYSLGWALKILCCRFAPEQVKEEVAVTSGKDTEPLLTTEPPPYAEKWQKVETV